jgi:hypothetical protein
MTRIWRGLGTTGAALIAVLLLSYAFVQSTVMQAAAASPTSAAPICGMASIAGMGGALADGGKATGHAAHHAACPFCAAAANPPLAGALILAPIPTTFAFVTFVALQSHGPRGPPAREPRARGPPIAPITA